MRIKIFTLLAMLFFTATASAQYVDEVNLAERPDLDYLEIMGVNMGIFKKKIVIIVDYGQKIVAFETDSRVKDETGKSIVFNSMMDAVNTFSRWGWELHSTYAVDSGQGGNVYHYILRRKKKAE